MRYRRANMQGGTYFFTVNLAERNRTLLVDHVDALKTVIREGLRRFVTNGMLNPDWGVAEVGDGNLFGE